MYQFVNCAVDTRVTLSPGCWRQDTNRRSSSLQYSVYPFSLDSSNTTITRLGTKRLVGNETNIPYYKTTHGCISVLLRLDRPIESRARPYKQSSLNFSSRSVDLFWFLVGWVLSGHQKINGGGVGKYVITTCTVCVADKVLVHQHDHPVTYLVESPSFCSSFLTPTAIVFKARTLVSRSASARHHRPTPLDTTATNSAFRDGRSRGSASLTSCLPCSSSSLLPGVAHSRLANLDHQSMRGRGVERKGKDAWGGLRPRIWHPVYS